MTEPELVSMILENTDGTFISKNHELANADSKGNHIPHDQSHPTKQKARIRWNNGGWYSENQTQVYPRRWQSKQGASRFSRKGNWKKMGDSKWVDQYEEARKISAEIRRTDGSSIHVNLVIRKFTNQSL